jgi:hypothetical protein
VANTLRAIHSGVAVDCVGSDITDLIKLGVVADRSTVSRRGLIRAGAVGVGAGIAVLAMPSVAASFIGVRRTEWSLGSRGRCPPVYLGGRRPFRDRPSEVPQSTTPRRESVVAVSGPLWGRRS